MLCYSYVSYNNKFISTKFLLEKPV